MAVNITSLPSSAYTIMSLVLQWWKLLVGIGIPTGVVIMLNVLAVIFRDVKLIKHGTEYTCEYPKYPIWQRHLIVRGFIWVHKPWGIEKKYDKAIKNYDEGVELTNTEITSIVSPIIDDADLGLPIYNGRIRGHPNEFIRCDFIPPAIIDIVIGLSENKLLIEKRSSGRFRLSVGAWILAQSESEDKFKKLMNLLQSVIDDNNVKGLATKVYNLEIEMRKLEKAFKKKLAKIVYRTRFWIEVLSFRLIKEQGISKR